MAYPDDITLDTADVDGGTARALKTIEWLAGQLTPLLGGLNSAAQSDPDAASANLNSILRGILANTGNGVVLTANMLNATTAAMTGTTSTQLFAAAGSGVKNMLSGLILANSSAVETNVQVLDGSTVIATLFVPAKSTVGFNFNVQLIGTANTAMNVKNVTTGASIIATGTGWKE